MTYLELIATIASAEKQHGIHELDVLSRQILQTIASANMAGDRVHMKDISWIATFPTLHSHVQRLIDTGWLDKTADESDRRATLLHITPRAMDVFRKLTEALDSPAAYVKRDSCPACIAKIRAQALAEHDRQPPEFDFVAAADAP
jgi:DNA-binding MarR family transcriptional regulator